MGNELKDIINEICLGRPVGVPTETVYGLAARIDLPHGIENIFKWKERPFFDPLIVHVKSVQQAKSLTTWWPQEADKLTQKFWPGPLTLVLPKIELINPMISSGLETIGIRWANHPLMQKLLESIDVPLAAPSANKFGRTSPTTAQHVKHEFHHLGIHVLDGGPCEVGIESTVVRLEPDLQGTKLAILRKGKVTQEEIESALKGCAFKFTESIDSKHSPGHMKHHYMPRVPLVLIDLKSYSSDFLNSVEQKLKEAPDVVESVKIIKPNFPIAHPKELKLSDDPTLATRQLYAELRKISEKNCDLIFFLVRDQHKGGNWEALMDRLNKAATLLIP